MYPARWFFNGRDRRADHRSRVAAQLRRRPVHRAGRLCTSRLRKRKLAGQGESAGELDLVRRRHHGDRHVHRAAARAGVCVRHERACRPARRTTSMILLLVFGAGVGVAARAARAADRRPSSIVAAVAARKADCSRRSSACAAPAGASASASARVRRPQRCAQELAALTAKGLTHDQIVEYFVNKWGSQEVLASPIDKGFNRLAWLLPYGVGAGGHRDGSSAWRCDGRDGGRRCRPPRRRRRARMRRLESRLDDELRDLD